MLCAAERITPWYHEDEVCWIADCEICATPMVVWRWHGVDPPAAELEHMLGRLADVAELLAQRTNEVEAEDPDPGYMMVTGFQRATAEVVTRT